MKTKEELAIDYADKNSNVYPHYEHSNPSHDSPPTDWGEIKAAYITGYEAAEPKWISTEDRLPELGAVVLAKIKGKNFPTIIYRDRDDELTEYWWESLDGGNWNWNEVTDWTPLPKLPEGK